MGQSARQTLERWANHELDLSKVPEAECEHAQAYLSDPVGVRDLDALDRALKATCPNFWRALDEQLARLVVPRLVDVRRRYPEYDELLDVELAEMLHRKHFPSDIPFAEFWQLFTEGSDQHRRDAVLMPASSVAH